MESVKVLGWLIVEGKPEVRAKITGPVIKFGAADQAAEKGESADCLSGDAQSCGVSRQAGRSAMALSTLNRRVTVCGIAFAKLVKVCGRMQSALILRIAASRRRQDIRRIQIAGAFERRRRLAGGP